MAAPVGLWKREASLGMSVLSAFSYKIGNLHHLPLQYGMINENKTTF
jgi:hypothetical protein